MYTKSVTNSRNKISLYDIRRTGMILLWVFCRLPSLPYREGVCLPTPTSTVSLQNKSFGFFFNSRSVVAEKKLA